jgi:hypothetical protein
MYDHDDVFEALFSGSESEVHCNNDCMLTVLLPSEAMSSKPLAEMVL